MSSGFVICYLLCAVLCCAGLCAENCMVIICVVYTVCDTLRIVCAATLRARCAMPAQNVCAHHLMCVGLCALLFCVGFASICMQSVVRTDNRVVHNRGFSEAAERSAYIQSCFCAARLIPAIRPPDTCHSSYTNTNPHSQSTARCLRVLLRLSQLTGTRLFERNAPRGDAVTSHTRTCSRTRRRRPKWNWT